MALFRTKHVHAGVVVLLDIPYGANITGVFVDIHLSAAFQKTDYGLTVECIVISGSCFVHQTEQSFLFDDITFQAFQFLAVIAAIKENVLYVTILTKNVVMVQTDSFFLGTDCGNLSVSRFVFGYGILQVNVGNEIAEHQNDLVLGNIVDIGGDCVQSFDRAAVVTGVGMGQTERRQHP